MTDAGAAAPILAALRRMGLLANAALPHCEPLTGGVSSDIWRVDLPEGPICVKRALPRLRVAANWEAPVERSRHEWAWYEVVSARVPGACPRPLARDDATDLFAMAYLAPDLHPLWKTQLLAGHVDRAVAYAVGRLLGRIHAATAGDPVLAAQFATDSCFAALRLDPYLTATAAAHPDVAAAILARRDETAWTRLALVHGDVSPKNILVGPQGPILLDAECAWYGDPAFDMAFCLNHLLLKVRALPHHAESLLAAASALLAAHRAEIFWEPADAFDARVARLLPALSLARIDGKSPVEYLVRDDDREAVRRTAKAMLLEPPISVADALLQWRRHVRR